MPLRLRRARRQPAPRVNIPFVEERALNSRPAVCDVENVSPALRDPPTVAPLGILQALIVFVSGSVCWRQPSPSTIRR